VGSRLPHGDLTKISVKLMSFPRREHGSEDFTAALRNLATQLGTTPGLIDYQRRQAMQDWCLAPGTWRELTAHLPSVPGPAAARPFVRAKSRACGDRAGLVAGD
jgi:hypothetical protein